MDMCLHTVCLVMQGIFDCHLNMEVVDSRPGTNVQNGHVNYKNVYSLGCKAVIFRPQISIREMILDVKRQSQVRQGKNAALGP